MVDIPRDPPSQKMRNLVAVDRPLPPDWGRTNLYLVQTPSHLEVVDGSSSGLSDLFSLLLSVVHILDSMVVSWWQRFSSQKATLRLVNTQPECSYNY
jgi:hypothetical protein